MFSSVKDSQLHSNTDDNVREFFLHCSVSPSDKPLRFLVDTGAEISLIKLQSLKQGIRIFAKKAIELVGISSSSNNVQTLGTCNAELIINDRKVYHPFQVINGNDVNLSQDAILGMDFLKKWDMKIIFSNSNTNEQLLVHPLTPDGLISEFLQYVAAFASNIFIPLIRQALR